MKKLCLVICLLHFSHLMSMEEKQGQQKWSASDYQKNSIPQRKAAEAILSKIDFCSNDCILDLGCGPGDITAYMGKKVPYGLVIGIDPSEDMIKKAQEKYNEKNNLIFVHANAETYEFDVEKFNLVTAFSSLHWIKKQQRVLNHTAKSLQANGKFLATLALDRSDNNARPLIKAMVATACSEKWRKYAPQTLVEQLDTENTEVLTTFIKTQAYPQSEENFRNMLIKAGLRPIELNPIERKLTFEHKEAFIAWLRSWVGGMPAFCAIPESEQADFMSEVVDCYLGYIPLHEGRIDYTSHILFVHAQK